MRILVRAPGLQPAGNQRRIAEPLERLDVRDGRAPFLLARRAAEDCRLGRAAPAVAAVGEQPRADRPVAHRAVRQREVPPPHLVRAELRLEPLARQERAGEDEQPAGLLVQPVHHAQRRVRAAAPAARAPREQVAHQPIQRTRLALVERHRAHARRLVHDDDVRINVHQLHGRRRITAPRPRRRGTEGNRRTGRRARAGAGRRRATDRDLAVRYSPARPAPRDLEQRADNPVQRRAAQLGWHEALAARRGSRLRASPRVVVAFHRRRSIRQSRPLLARAADLRYERGRGVRHAAGGARR